MHFNPDLRWDNITIVKRRAYYTDKIYYEIRETISPQGLWITWGGIFSTEKAATNYARRELGYEEEE